MWQSTNHTVGSSLCYKLTRTCKPAKESFFVLLYLLGIEPGTISVCEAPLPLAHSRHYRWCCGSSHTARTHIYWDIGDMSFVSCLLCRDMSPWPIIWCSKITCLFTAHPTKVVQPSEKAVDVYLLVYQHNCAVGLPYRLGTIAGYDRRRNLDWFAFLSQHTRKI